jgi:hypothetical protein
MDYSETLAELEGFVGKPVWVGVFAGEAGERYSVLTAAGAFEKLAPVDPAFAGEVGVPEGTTFSLGEASGQLTVWAHLLVGAELFEVSGARLLRLELGDGTGIDLAEFPEDEARLLGLA